MAAPKKKPTTAVVAWQDQLASAATKQQAAEQPTGGFRSISTRGGILSIDDNPVKGNELRCVVIMGVHENQFFEGAYNPSVIQQPVCYAFNDPTVEGSEDSMAPVDGDVKDKQADACEGCWANEMGSAETGRGKACKNVRRLAVITEDQIDNIDEAEVRMIKIPVTSVKNWGKYVHRIAEEMQRPSWGVVTLISIVPDPKTQFKIQFSFENEVEFTQEIMDGMQRKLTELSKTMIAPYNYVAEEEAKSTRGKAAAAKPVRGKGTMKPAPARTAGKRKF